MIKHVLCVLCLTPAVLLAGNAPVIALKAGPSPIAAPSQAQTAAVKGDASIVAPQIPISFTELPGAYDAAIANGATPNSNGHVEISINGVEMTIDQKDAVVPR